MEYWQAIVLGVVQGIAEFLPISSSGHLVLAESILDLQADNLAFTIAVHVGTLLSILVVYRSELWSVARQPRVIAAIILATLPIVLVGLLLKDELEQAFNSPLAAGIALCFTAGILWVSQWFDRGETELSEISLRQALVVGLFQAVAPIPGISRSGVTIVGGLLAGMNRQTAATFSFLIAIPAILGAAVLEAWSLLQKSHLSSEPWSVYGLGAGVAFVIGVIALRGLLKVISARKLHAFAWYCLGVGLLAIVVSMLGQ